MERVRGGKEKEGSEGRTVGRLHFQMLRKPRESQSLQVWQKMREGGRGRRRCPGEGVLSRIS